MFPKTSMPNIKTITSNNVGVELGGIFKKYLYTVGKFYFKSHVQFYCKYFEELKLHLNAVDYNFQRIILLKNML